MWFERVRRGFESVRRFALELCKVVDAHNGLVFVGNGQEPDDLNPDVVLRADLVNQVSHFLEPGLVQQVAPGHADDSAVTTADYDSGESMALVKGGHAACAGEGRTGLTADQHTLRRCGRGGFRPPSRG